MKQFRDIDNLKLRNIFLILVAILIVYFASSGYMRMSIIPMFEGLNVGIHGFSPYGSSTTYDTSQDLPLPYVWISRDPYNAIIQKENCKVAIEIGLAYKEDPIKTVHYTVKTGEDNSKVYYKEIIGLLVPYYLDLQIYVPPGSYGEFQGDIVWFVAQTVKWNRAISDPTNPYKSYVSSYSIPIAIMIDDYKVVGFKDPSGALIQPNSNMLEYAQLSPSMEGRIFALYSEPSSYAKLSDLYQDPQTIIQTLNQSLTGNPTPDTRFKQQVFFPINLVKFGTYASWKLLWTDYYYPSVYYKLKVYYLQFGEFVFSVDKSMVEDWEKRESVLVNNQPSIFEAIAKWFSSPLNIFGLWVTGIVAFIIVIIIALILAFGLPTVLSWIRGGIEK